MASVILVCPGKIRTVEGCASIPKVLAGLKKLVNAMTEVYKIMQNTKTQGHPILELGAILEWQEVQARLREETA